MRITGIKSICCGDGVKTMTPTQREKSKYLYTCLKCGCGCDSYFTAEITRRKK